MRILKERRRVNRHEVARYAKLTGNLETRKSHRNGVIGIARNGGRWVTNYPAFLRIKRKSSESALGAAIEYNRQMLALFGEDAVLCDVHAAMELDKRRRK